MHPIINLALAHYGHILTGISVVAVAAAKWLPAITAGREKMKKYEQLIDDTIADLNKMFDAKNPQDLTADDLAQLKKDYLAIKKS
jgi:hypothetical protein